jgi:hypothetical protein
MLFVEVGWELHEQGRRELSKIVLALQGVTGKQIVIEGYTDNRPIEAPLTRRFPLTGIFPRPAPPQWSATWPAGDRRKPVVRSVLRQVSSGRRRMTLPRDAPKTAASTS